MKEEVVETDKFPDIAYEGSVASLSELGSSGFRVNLTVSCHSME